MVVVNQRRPIGAEFFKFGKLLVLWFVDFRLVALVVLDDSLLVIQSSGKLHLSVFTESNLVKTDDLERINDVKLSDAECDSESELSDENSERAKLSDEFNQCANFEDILKT